MSKARKTKNRARLDLSKLTIDKNVALVSIRHRNHVTMSDVISKMEPGHSILLPRLGNAIYAKIVAKRLGVRATVRTVNDGWRVWRLAPAVNPPAVS